MVHGLTVVVPVGWRSTQFLLLLGLFFLLVGLMRRFDLEGQRRLLAAGAFFSRLMLLLLLLLFLLPLLLPPLLLLLLPPSAPTPAIAMSNVRIIQRAFY